MAGKAEPAVGEVVEVRSPAFVSVQIEAGSTQEPASVISLQATLPNGVTIDLRELQPRHLADVVGALGRLRCSASTTD